MMVKFAINVSAFKYANELIENSTGEPSVLMRYDNSQFCNFNIYRIALFWSYI